MTFKQLLTARDEADGLLTECETALEQAKKDYELAVANHEFAVNSLAAANEAIRERLTEKGHHSVQAADGTFVVYHATDKAEIGWAAYHPIPGDAS